MQLLLDLTTHKPGTSFDLIRDDFNKRYAETYMQIVTKANPTEELLYIETLTNNATLNIYGMEGIRFPLPIQDVISLKPWIPKSGYYQLPTRSIYIERRAARQWKRSFAFNMYNTDLEHRDLPILYKAWKNQVVLFSLNDVDDDSPPIKLTNQLATMWSDRHGLCIAFEDQIIAKIQAANKKIKLTLLDFEQEIKDYLTKNKLLDWKIIK